MGMISPVEITLAAFSVITAILIGWQIYAIINIDRKIKDKTELLIHKEIAIVREELSDQINKRLQHTMAAVHFNIAQTFTSEEQYRQAFVLYVTALIEWWKYDKECNEFKLCLDSIVQLVEVLKLDKDYIIPKNIAVSLIGALAEIDTTKVGVVVEFTIDRCERVYQ